MHNWGSRISTEGDLEPKILLHAIQDLEQRLARKLVLCAKPRASASRILLSSPVYRDTWNSLPMGEEAAQALDLLDRMLKLKEQGLQGEQITRHFIKTRLASIKERSRTAFEFDGKHDPNRENPESVEFKIMQERMYKIFSNAIVVSYSHLLPVVPYNAFNPPPPVCIIQLSFSQSMLLSSVKSTENLEYHAQEFALMKSDPPIAQRCSPRRHTGQASGGPKIQSDVQPNASRSTNQSDSRKRKLVSSDDEGDDAEKTGNKGVTGKQPKPTNPKKKTSSRPIPKIRKSSRYKSFSNFPCIAGHSLLK